MVPMSWSAPASIEKPRYDHCSHVRRPDSCSGSGRYVPLERQGWQHSLWSNRTTGVCHLPYDVLNDAGIVIDHVDDPTQSADAHAMELAEEVEEKKRAPLISEKERQLEADRLLVVQYDSEEEILDLLDKETGTPGNG